MEPITQLFLILLTSGLLLIAIEVFVPGGVLGTIGALSLLGAIGIAFQAFGPKNGFLAAVGIILFSGLFLLLWLNYFPRTRIGRAITLSRSGSAFKASDAEDKSLIGMEGISLTELHPAGIANIAGNRVDVVADGTFIDQSRPIKVLSAEGNHITVCEVETSNDRTKET